MKYDWFGFEDEGLPTRLSFVFTGIWWIGFSQYTYYYLPVGNKKQKMSRDVMFNGFKELKLIWNSLQKQLALKRYLVSFFTYSIAVQTIMLIATYFGLEELEWGEQDPTTGLIVSILLIQLVAVVGATLTARIALKIGNIKTLIILNLFWIAICVFAYFIVSPQEFYVAAACVGLIMGGNSSIVPFHLFQNVTCKYSGHG